MAAYCWPQTGAHAFQATRRYLERTLVLETTFSTATGSVTLVDALAVGRNDRGHQLGAGAPSALLRRVTGVAGSVELSVVDHGDHLTRANRVSGPDGHRLQIARGLRVEHGAPQRRDVRRE